MEDVYMQAYVTNPQGEKERDFWGRIRFVLGHMRAFIVAFAP